MTFCPKCGTQALTTDQKYCKLCGTNLEAVNEVLEKGANRKDGTKTLPEIAGDFVSTIVDTVKESVGEVNINKTPRAARKSAEWAIHKENWELQKKASIEKWQAIHEAREKRRAARRAERAQPQMPKPKEWLTYSRQHNLKHGLMGLLGGSGLGLFLYYASKTALESGLVQQIEEAAQQHPVVGLEFGLRVVWLIAAIPVLKGFGQILYAAFFAESIKTLAERFAPPVQAPTTEKTFSRNTAPQNTSPIFESLPEVPPSITEGTTKFFDDAEKESDESPNFMNRAASERG
ncbi:MAG: hypothetical protein AB1757_24670 [Acidobacteriota bacterium]